MSRLFMLLLISNVALTRTATVKMVSGKRFEPAVVTIKAGDTVTWTNTDTVLHSATAKAQNGKIPFNSGMLPKDRSYSHTFTEPGTYDYFCVPHQNMGMKGQVVVE